MASDNSAKPILVAGAVGTVALLGVAWMFTASTGNQAVIDAKEYAESRALAVDANFEAKVEPSEDDEAEVAEAEEPAETEVAEIEVEEAEAAEAEPEKPAEVEEAEPEVAEAEAAEPAETEVAEAEPEKEAEPEVAEAEPETEAGTEVAEAEAEPEKEAEPEVAEAEAEPEKEAEPEAAEAEAAEPAETEAAAAETEAPAEEAPAATAVAALTGDAKKGAKVFRKCKACHKIGEGAKSAVGPYLTDVIGRTMGSVDGFKYSDVFKKANAEGKVWTPEELAAFLTKPKDYMPGTKMAFAGLRKEADRDDVIAYLATNGE